MDRLKDLNDSSGNKSSHGFIWDHIFSHLSILFGYVKTPVLPEMVVLMWWWLRVNDTLIFNKEEIGDFGGC